MRLRIGPVSAPTAGNVVLRTDKPVTDATSRRRTLVTLSRKSFTIAQGDASASLNMRLSLKNRKLLKRLKRVRVRAR